MTRKVKLGWLPNQNYTPLTKSTFSENQAMAYKAGRAETFGQMGLDLLNEKLDESRFIAEEEWNPTYRYWREGLDWGHSEHCIDGVLDAIAKNVNPV